jgi:hypothetical protein
MMHKITHREDYVTREAKGNHFTTESERGFGALVKTREPGEMYLFWKVMGVGDGHKNAFTPLSTIKAMTCLKRHFSC